MDAGGLSVGSLIEQGLEARTYGRRPGVCADGTAAVVSSGCLPDPIWDDDFGRLLYSLMGYVIVGGAICVSFFGFWSSCGLSIYTTMTACVAACGFCTWGGRSKDQVTNDGDVVDFNLSSRL